MATTPTTPTETVTEDGQPVTTTTVETIPTGFAALSTPELLQRLFEAKYVAAEVKAGEAAITTLVIERLIAEHAATGGKTFQAKFDGEVAGSVTLTEPSSSPVLPDTAQLLNYAEDNYGNDAVETITQVKATTIAAIKAAAAGRRNAIVNDDTGLVVTERDGAPLVVIDGAVIDTITGDTLDGHTVHTNAVVDTVKQRIIPGARWLPAGPFTSMKPTWKAATAAERKKPEPPRPGREVVADAVDGRLINRFATAGITETAPAQVSA